MAQKFLADSVYQDSIRNTQSDSIKGWAYLQLAKKKVWYDKELAQSYIDSAEMYDDFTRPEESRASISFTKGTLERAKGNNKEALSLMKNALSIYEKGDNKYMISTILYNLGAIQLGMGKSVEAASHFHDGLDLSRERKDTTGTANFLNALGVVQRRAGDLNAAQPYYEEALQIYKMTNNLNGQATCLVNLAIIKKSTKEYQKAISLYTDALKIADEMPNAKPSLYASIYSNLSALYSDQKQYDKSLDYSLKSFEIRKELAETQELFTTHLGLGINYMELGNYAKASYHFDEADKHTENNHNSLLQLKKTRSNLNRKQGNYRNALTLLEESIVHKDSIYDNEKAKQIDELNVEFETERKESEIQRLSMESELDQARISRQRIGLFSSVTGLGLLSFFLLRLRQKNQKIQKQDKEKEVLLKEIHHRVKNNLQVISSLLGLQGLTVEDQKAKEALQEGRTRVHSMALIHQNLYKEDELTGINMPDYLKKLGNNLVNTYHYEGKDISCKTESDDIILDVETVVPLGLIVNELVTNCLKYAFESRDSGQIFISLHESAGQLVLKVKDDGIGINSENANSADGFGLSLIDAFRQKLGAEVSIISEDGTSVEILINNYKKIT